MTGPARRSYDLDELAELAARLRVTLDPAKAPVDGPAMVGTVLVHEVQPGLFAIGYDVDCLTDIVLSEVVEPSVLCGVNLDTVGEPMVVDGYGDVRFEPGQAVLLGFGHHSQCISRPKGGTRRAYAGFSLKPEFFDDLPAGRGDDHVWRLADLLDDGVSVQRLAGRPTLNDFAHRTLSHPYQGLLSDLFVESCALALVAEVGRLVADRAKAMSGVALSGKQRDRVQRAREILDDHLVSPPTVRELSRQVGINATTLQAEFQQAYGTAVFGYIRERRLQMAQALLRTQELPVSGIGYRVGFNNPAAFATAYRRRFGYPPSQERPSRR